LADPTKFSKLSSVTFADFTDAIVITTALEDEGYKQFKNIIETSLIKEVTEGKE
jgi:DeoR family fructose operon transcriptional repressor